MVKVNTGVIVTQQGVDIKGAADYQKTIDTRWRFLDIIFEQEIEFTISGTNAGTYYAIKLFDHTLNYLPAFTYRIISGDQTLLTNPVLVSDTNSIYFRGRDTTTTPIKLKIFLRIFAVDITAEFIAPVDFIVPGAKPSYSNVGIKILKNPGAGMQSLNIADYSINTFAKALAIHQTGLRTANTANSGTLTVVHNLGYPPTLFMAKYEIPTDWKNSLGANPLPTNLIQAMNPASGAGLVANTTQVVITGGQAPLAGTWAVLITKDPTELAV